MLPDDTMALLPKSKSKRSIIRRDSVESVFALDVDADAKAIDVKTEFEELFKTKVADVRLGRRQIVKKLFGRKRDSRKAYVRLKEGDILPGFVESPPPAPKHYLVSDFLPVPAHDVGELVRVIEAGLPISDLERFQIESGLPMARLAKLIRVPPRTLARRREEGRLSAEESDRLVRLARLLASATNLFGGDVAAAVAWLSKPLVALGGAVPLNAAETEAGAHEVERVIQQLEHGVFP